MFFTSGKIAAVGFSALVIVAIIRQVPSVDQVADKIIKKNLEFFEITWNSFRAKINGDDVIHWSSGVDLNGNLLKLTRKLNSYTSLDVVELHFGKEELIVDVGALLATATHAEALTTSLSEQIEQNLILAEEKNNLIDALMKKESMLSSYQNQLLLLTDQLTALRSDAEIAAVDVSQEALELAIKYIDI